jgi:hypothetical protein
MDWPAASTIRSGTLARCGRWGRSGDRALTRSREIAHLRPSSRRVGKRVSGSARQDIREPNLEPSRLRLRYEGLLLIHLPERSGTGTCAQRPGGSNDAAACPERAWLDLNRFERLASAQSRGTLPSLLTNVTIADTTQATADFNARVHSRQHESWGGAFGFSYFFA